jgi:protein-S-isoprenylcysteine O-methyltransferase Ste14
VFQSLAILFAAGGLALRAWGSGCAGRHTRTATIEAPRLITDGPFAYMRNPIYTGTMCLAKAYLLTGLAFFCLYLGIVPAEEEFLHQQFGADYARYCAAVPRFLPRIRPWPGRVRRAFHWQAARGEFVIALWATGIYLALWGEEWLDKVWG